ncbi:uncharacterized protein LOC8275246 isoform X1 [Ricinus communis]|uniref:uncharacterized protein LOC8275246 isoform X1 n=1 Tax=Ricinus communis TaxID=3988 RepID=UPI00201AC0A5|nr:uncharacterized protein LOC8275246 isoform X1 [Ricinus communis]XP_015577590.2 uncharacterized protein LOC8275246 isoform X1 [Ricinus communis]XP_015577591.2 uncharacterized protein LOC8275246 isoform X1 [Ricinus communis]XP_015577592.2 uncharacterized protein LOC8275246 isoform X1 [Ricinus communis]
MDSTNPNPPSVRVLTRPPTPAPSPDTQPLSSQSQTQLFPRSRDGVIVVGFISHNPDHSSQLINRVLDSNVFGSGHLDKLLSIDKEELKDWFKWRRISYYHDEEKGFLFLQFCSIRCPVVHGSSRSGLLQDLDSVLEENEFEDLQGLLFMFSVCHVIIYIQEGLRFDPHSLKKFRVLQAAKHALAPYVRSRSTPPLPSRPHSSSASSKPSPSTSSSPGRGGGIMSRNASAISLMSGLGSYTSLFPGNCTPVILFVFVDDLFDMPNPNSNVEESKDVPSLNQSSSMSSVARPNLPTKGSGSVVVLARPVNKSEGGFRKKLQSSLEAQIRFLIKKCRTLSGSESGHTGSRSGGVSNSAPLFSLDASRAVVLLDRLLNQKGESLEFASDLVEDILNGKATSDSLLLENHSQNANKEEIVSVKEFIHRQSDILRGRGGLVTSANTGPATGVGMVAVAAAAAAASAASGKTFTTPELPSMEVWLSTSQLILQGVLSAKRGCIDEPEVGKRKSRQRNSGPIQVEGFGPRGMDPLDVAVSLLESGRGLNTKFSTLWCERTLPTAKDVYLKDLPACYPTSQHEAHLEKALQAFHSLVRGPAVPLFTKRLEDECTSIWKSGRQLCDAVSLTGKPCKHQRHDVGNAEKELLNERPVKPHSSGYFFLHACACGRSRQLRSDPFDFQSANINSSCFQDCDKLLPAVQLPEQSNVGPVQSSSWSLIRVGGARYYEPAKGLLQSGFSASQKFLLKWTIVLEKPVSPNGLPAKTMRQGSVIRQGIDSLAEIDAKVDGKRTGATRLNLEDIQGGVENQGKLLENGKIGDKKNSFGRGIPNFTMRKPFSEVVAGSSTNDSGFPPLQQRKHPSSGTERGVKTNRARDRNAEHVHTTVDQGSKKYIDTISGQETLNRISISGEIDGDPCIQRGTNVVPMSINGGEMVKLNPALKHELVYVGFEHECPRGHRFLLSPDHLNEIGAPYSLPEVSQVPSVETSNYNFADAPYLGKNGVHAKMHRSSKGATVTAANKVRNVDKQKETGANGALHVDRLIQFPNAGKEHNHSIISEQKHLDFVKNLELDFHSISLDDGGSAFSMLNRNLPIYLNCPYCKRSKNKKDSQKTKFAGTISQLLRIFLVTPPSPIVLATCPVVQFEASCLPLSVADREQKLQFSLGCRVILPPESFLALRLPFVYGVQLENRSPLPLNAFEHQPEMTAWIVKGTTLQVISKGSSLKEEIHT